MDPISTIVIFLGVLVVMGAAILLLLTKIAGQVQAIIDAQASSIDPTTAAQINTAAQGISDSLTAAGFPPAP